MEPNYIFGLNKRLLSYEEPIRTGWLIDTGGRDYRIGMGTPCLVMRADADEGVVSNDSRGARKAVLIPFTLNSNGVDYGNRLVLDNRSNVNSLSIKVGEETDFFDTIKELKVDRVDLSKVDRAIEFARTGGPLTLLVNDDQPKRLVTDLKKLTKHLGQKFNYAFHNKYAQIGNRGLKSGEECFLAITVMDIGQCIPVFDPTKVDGVMLNVTTYYTMATEQSDSLINSCEFTFFFSNYKTNLTKIDGQKLGRGVVSPSTLSSIVDTCAGHFEDVGKAKQKKEVKKTERKEKKEELQLRRGGGASYIATPSSISSSSTSYYYSTKNTW